MKTNQKPLTLKRALITYTKVFTAILVLLLIFVYLVLADYEKNLPSAPGNQVLNAIETLDMETLDELSSNLPISLKDPDVFTKYLKTFGDDPELYFYAGTSKVENQLVYIVMNHEKKMATLILEKTGKKSAFGFEQVKVIDLVFKPLHPYKIIVTTPVELMVNGVSIAQQVQDLKQEPLEAFDLEAFGSIDTQTYTFDDFMYIDSVTVVDQPQALISYDPLSYTYTIALQPEALLQEKLADFGESVIKAHTRLLCIPGHSRTTFLNDYAYPGSHFESTVKLYDLTVRYPFISESWADLSIANYLQYGPHAYSVDVSIKYTWTATWVGQVKTRTQTPSYRIYVTDLNGTWQVTSMDLAEPQ
jgi:hypothetical protein